MGIVLNTVNTITNIVARSERWMALVDPPSRRAEHDRWDGWGKAAMHGLCGEKVTCSEIKKLDRVI
jgi:hypothetical protein